MCINFLPTTNIAYYGKQSL